MTKKEEALRYWVKELGDVLSLFNIKNKYLACFISISHLLKHLKVILIIKNELDGCHDYTDNSKFKKTNVIHVTVQLIDLG